MITVYAFNGRTFFMARKGYIYTIAVDFYAYRLAFSSILPYV